MKKLVAVEAVVLVLVLLIGYAGARTAGAFLFVGFLALAQGIILAAVVRLLMAQWREYHRKDKEDR